MASCQEARRAPRVWPTDPRGVGEAMRRGGRKKGEDKSGR